MNSIAKTAELLTAVVEAEEILAAAEREANAAERKADRAALKVAVQRTRRADAAKGLRLAQKAGKGVNAAARRVAVQDRQVADRIEAAHEARTTARAARRIARAAARRLDRISLRAATLAARTVGKIASRLGKENVAKAPKADVTLAAEELPTVEEIETRADQYAELDAQAKDLGKQADAVKTWLRQLPVGTYGRTSIIRTPGGTIIDGDQVAIEYLDNGLGAPPRKGRKDTFKVLVAAAEAAAPITLAPAA